MFFNFKKMENSRNKETEKTQWKQEKKISSFEKQIILKNIFLFLIRRGVCYSKLIEHISLQINKFAASRAQSESSRK